MHFPRDDGQGGCNRLSLTSDDGQGSLDPLRFHFCLTSDDGQGCLDHLLFASDEGQGGCHHLRFTSDDSQPPVCSPVFCIFARVFVCIRFGLLFCFASVAYVVLRFLRLFGSS